MQYIIFGAGQTGTNAMRFLGYWRVACFADNAPHEPIDDKEVVAYDNMLQMINDGDYIVVVASARYNAEMVAQLKADGVVRYFVFHDAAPVEMFQVYPGYSLHRQYIFIPFVKAISLLEISKYKKIGIYGDNFFLPYLISEIAFQNDINNIVCAIPSEFYANTNFLGIPIAKLNDALNKVDCIIVNKRREEICDEDALILEECHKCDILYLYNLEPYIPEFYHPELIKYKDIHKGQRCFLVGNGPSMRIEDLNTLYEHGEICFGFNKIYRIYDKTKWRANYLGIADYLMMENCRHELAKVHGEIIVADEYHHTTEVHFPFVQYVHLISERYNNNHPGFTDDICKGIFWGSTVTYELGIQLAAYMGFTEIFLIGVDCTVSGNVTDKGNHFIDNYFYEDEKKSWDIRKSSTPDLVRLMKKSFEKAEIYSRKHGFRIYNATRGGALEAFERVDFDKLF
ncbi:MAG: hypothetical protein IKN43_14920 [Selenomonadaceae bacterium]|nr:hypothetical protein [Selenomonadaceae bacterium]